MMRQQSAPSPKAPALSPAQLREYASLDVDAILAKKVALSAAPSRLLCCMTS